MNKRTLILGGVAVLVGLALGVQFLLDSGTQMPELQPSAPIETLQPVAGEPLQQVTVVSSPMSTEQNNTKTGNEANISSDTMVLDAYFAGRKTKSSSNELPAMATPAAGGGMTVKLPELKNPQQLAPLKAPPSAGGGQMFLPVQVPQPITVTISGVICTKGICKASTSAGILSQGDVIGSGAMQSEKIEQVTMAGIKTDHRFIAY